YQSQASVAIRPFGVTAVLTKAAATKNGTVSITGTTARYTPASGFYGSDSFTYRATGPGGNSPTRTVTVTVGNPPAPGAGNVSASTAYQTAANITLTPTGVYTSVSNVAVPLI